MLHFKNTLICYLTEKFRLSLMAMTLYLSYLQNACLYSYYYVIKLVVLMKYYDRHAYLIFDRK